MIPLTLVLGLWKFRYVDNWWRKLHVELCCSGSAPSHVQLTQAASAAHSAQHCGHVGVAVRTCSHRDKGPREQLQSKLYGKWIKNRAAVFEVT